MPITSGKGYVAGAFALEIEGQFAGFLTSVEGGGVYGEVVSSPAGADGVVRKQVGRVGYDEIVVTCGIPEGSWAQWLEGFLGGKAPQHDGAVVFLNYNHVPIRRLEWQHATIASITFPRLDGSGKEPAHLTVAIRPESTVEAAASGALKSSFTKTKAWTSSNFVVDIPGVDCSRVDSVAPLTVSQTHVEDEVGSTRRPARKLGPLQIGDLVLTVAQSGAAGFTGWRDDFIVKGNNGQAQEKTATVLFKSPNLKDDLFSLVLAGVGIHRLDPDKLVQGSGSISRLTASMYCEEAALSLPKPPEAAPAAPATPAAPAAPAADPGTAGPASAPSSPLSRLGEPGSARLEPAEVARRLLISAETGPVVSGAGEQRRRGTRLGSAWAQRMASLDELTQLVAVARGDWTAIALPEGHSLAEALQEAGVVPTEHVGDLELDRDPFVEGLVDGATDAYADVKDELARARQP